MRQTEQRAHTLQPTALVHEAYLKLVRQRSVDWQGRAHFFGVAAQVMRRILVDHARGHLRGKRGSGQRSVPIDEALAFTPEQSEDLVKLDQSLERLTKIDPRQGKIVELRVFGGLTVEQTAEMLDVSPKTVKRDWSMAKAWLHGDLKRSVTLRVKNKRPRREFNARLPRERVSEIWITCHSHSAFQRRKPPDNSGQACEPSGGL